MSYPKGRPMERRYEGTCERCGTLFTSARPTARYCGHNCVKRACDERNRAVCSCCGGKLGARSGWPNAAARGSSEICGACQAEKAGERKDAIIAGYLAGKTPAEIAAELGTTAQSIATAAKDIRREGVELPFAPTGAAHGRVAA